MDIKLIDKVLGVSKAVDADWFASEIERSDASPWKPVFHILDLSVPSSAVVNLMRSGSQTVTQALNKGDALVAGVAYRFSIPLFPGDTYNLQYTGIAGPQLVTVRITESLEP